MDIRSICWYWIRRLFLAGLVGVFAFRTLPVRAHETDNFFLPLDKEMADVGEFLEAVHTLALEEAVAEVNARIERALKIKEPATREKELARWYQPEALARAVVGRFSAAAVESPTAVNALNGSWARRAYPGGPTTHYSMWMNFAAHIPLDPRMLIMLSQAATLKAYGVYFGADKLTHFHHLGWDYYSLYCSSLAAGSTREEAYRKVLKHYTAGGVLGEANLFGTLGTGVFSNADMAANHAGFKFFVNLTEPVVLKGTERPPLLVRCGVFWRLNQHVRPRSGWFACFISDHWNEALNPSLYDATMRPGIRRVLRHRAGAIVQFYTQNDRRPKDPAYFDTLAHELSTWYGEPYGHSGQFEKLMTIGNTCLPALQEHGAGDNH